MQRTSKVVVAVVLIVGGTMSALAQDGASPAEQQIFQLTNQARAENGLGQLTWDASLAYAAKAHVELMVKNQILAHQYPGEADLTTRAGQAGAHFQAIAENIAQGPSAEAVAREWMKSAPHRANILDPKMTSLGVAAIENSGTLYAVEDFANGVAQMSAEQVEQKVGQLLQQRGIEPSGPKQDARQTCPMQTGNAGSSRPLLVMRWQGSDLSKLPDVLEQQIRSGKYHTAAIGACPPADLKNGFTSYRVAALLY
jgi:hypothetical protein